MARPPQKTARVAVTTSTLEALGPDDLPECVEVSREEAREMEGGRPPEITEGGSEAAGRRGAVMESTDRSERDCSCKRSSFL